MPSAINLTTRPHDPPYLCRCGREFTVFCVHCKKPTVSTTSWNTATATGIPVQWRNFVVNR